MHMYLSIPYITLYILHICIIANTRETENSGMNPILLISSITNK